MCTNIYIYILNISGFLFRETPTLHGIVGEERGVARLFKYTSLCCIVLQGVKVCCRELTCVAGLPNHSIIDLCSAVFCRVL